MVDAALRIIPQGPERRSTHTDVLSARRRPRRSRRHIGVVATVLACYSALPPVHAAAQEANISTTVASVGSGTAASLINLDAVKAKPATDRRLALPSLAVTDDGSGPRVRRLVLDLPEAELGELAIASRLGDQPLPAVFRSDPLAGSALTSSMRGLTLTTTGAAPVSMSIGQLGTVPDAGHPALAAASVRFTPNGRLSVIPHVLIPVGSPDGQTSVGTAIQANVAGNLALTTGVGVAGSGDSAWAPMASARLAGQWNRGGIETSVLHGAAAPRTDTQQAFVSSRDRASVRAQVQPLRDLTVVALTSSSRPAAQPDADETRMDSLRIAYDGLPAGQLATLRQREVTASRESATTSIEWRQRGHGRMAVRYVHQWAGDPALDGADQVASRVEVDLPALVPRSAGRLDLRAALTAGSSSLKGPELNSRVSGRLGLVDHAAVTGETEIGVSGGNGQVLRALRVTTDMPVVPTARLQLSYAYRAGTQFPIGQVLEARILRRLNLDW